MSDAPTPVELNPQQATAQRQAAWREQSLVRIRRLREKRLGDLQQRHDQVERALTAYLALAPPADLVVRLRAAFVALDRARDLPETLAA